MAFLAIIRPKLSCMKLWTGLSVPLQDNAVIKPQSIHIRRGFCACAIVKNRRKHSLFCQSRHKPLSAAITGDICME
jgi:hypothetical protein